MTWILAAAAVASAACVGAGPDPETVGSLAFAAGPADPAAGDATIVYCPVAQPGPRLRDVLCRDGGCDEAVFRELGRPTARWAQVGERAFVDRIAAPSDWNACDLLPEDGGCALACDPDALIAGYIREGTCVMFHCPLADGTSMLAGGCHP